MKEPKHTPFDNLDSRSEWPDDDWENLLSHDPQQLEDYQDEAEALELDSAGDEEDRLFAPYLTQRRAILYDDPPTYDCTEYEYNTDDFIEEFFDSPDSPAWEALFP